MNTTTDDVVQRARAVLDEFLATTAARSMYSASELQNLALDIRLALANGGTENG